MLLFQTYIYDVHTHTDATSRRRSCPVVIKCVVQSVDEPPHCHPSPSARSLHNDDEHVQQRLVIVRYCCNHPSSQESSHRLFSQLPYLFYYDRVQVTNVASEWSSCSVLHCLYCLLALIVKICLLYTSPSPRD